MKIKYKNIYLKSFHKNCCCHYSFCCLCSNTRLILGKNNIEKKNSYFYHRKMHNFGNPTYYRLFRAKSHYVPYKDMVDN